MDSVEIQDESSAGCAGLMGELELKREPQIGCDVACMVSQWSRQLSPHYLQVASVWSTSGCDTVAPLDF